MSAEIPKKGRLFGAEAKNMGYLAAQIYEQGLSAPLLVVLPNHPALETTRDELEFFLPRAKILPFPAWDVQPYDRLSADPSLMAQRLATLAALRDGVKKAVILTTVNALSTRVPPQISKPLELRPGEEYPRDALLKTLINLGYRRVETVMEPGEVAVRGAIVDIFPPLLERPLRLDFFDDELETLRFFNPANQRAAEKTGHLTLFPITEVPTEPEVSLFRRRYRALFPEGGEDALYVDISAGRANPMAGHFLPLFYEEPLPSLFDLLPAGSRLLTSPSFTEAVEARRAEIDDSYQSRLSLLEETADWQENETYRPIPPDLLYLGDEDWRVALETFPHLALTSFDDGGEDLHRAGVAPVDLPAHNRLDAAVSLAKEIRKAGGAVLFSAFSPSALARVEKTLAHHGMEGHRPLKKWQEFTEDAHINLAVTPLAWGVRDIENNRLLLTEQDLFGEKSGRQTVRKRRPEEVISHFSELSPGDFVVHVDHGIGTFSGIKTLSAGGAAQDFVELLYAGDDKLYVPVVSLDVLSRFSGGDGGPAQRDKLGGAAWQARKAKVKKDLMAMAGDLIKIAAERHTRKGHRYEVPGGLYDEFCARFPYTPTPEQTRAAEEVEADLTSSRPMDRLVVGDVGFGKTEVALRAAFIAAADGRQVAVLVPTTLLARQHLDVFRKRFADLPVTVAGLSRLTTAVEAKKTKTGLANGTVDIVIGTHALLADKIHFKHLGLLIVDEEQHFGVAHKEKIKKLKATVDVLTLTATPIPRTLQMSLGGLRELSLITTPPVDRLAVRTYVMKPDPKVLREAITREIFRNGQVFVVTHRVQGIEKLAEKISALVPEAKVRHAHGQMPKAALERIMGDFYEGTFNVLVSTTIVESGLDVPRANTLIVFNADRFGLGQLYQLRGRVGRSSHRAYAYFLLPAGHISENAEKRLRVLQRLQELGSGFKLASYDMDIRGAGNILGTQQSGHIREVGFELYSQMLREAIAELKSGAPVEEGFSPVLNLGLSCLLPETYVGDQEARLTLYRRLAHAATDEELAMLREELADRFGPLPVETNALLLAISLKNRCRKLNIERVDAGDKGFIFTLHKNRFPKPEGLLRLITENPGFISLRPDHKLVLHRPALPPEQRMDVLSTFLDALERLPQAAA